MNRRWKVALLAVGVVGVVELLLRVYGYGDPPLMRLDPKLEYVSVAGTYQRFGRTIRINSLGMRGDEPRPIPPDLRILLIGDSIVHGTYRTDQDETISAALARELSRLRPDVTVEVFNAATSSWGPVNQRAYLESVGTLDATVCVWVLSSHDRRDVPVPGEAELLPQRRPVLALEDVWWLLRRRWPSPAAPGGDPVAATEQAVEALVPWLGARGCHLVVGQHFSKAELASRLSEDGRALRAHFEALGVEVIGLDAALAGVPLAYADELHLSPEGTAAVGRYLAKELVKQLPWD